MNGYIEELDRSVGRAESESSGWAWAIAKAVARGHEPGRQAVARFADAEQRRALAEDLRCIELYGVFANRVTHEIINARWARP